IKVAVLGRQISALENELGPLTAVDTTPGHLIQPASLPAVSSGIGKKKLAVLGLLFGMALGVGAALLLERFPSRVRSQADLEDLLGAPVLVAVPSTARRKLSGGVLTTGAPKSTAAEAYRVLAALTGHLSEDKGL